LLKVVGWMEPMYLVGTSPFAQLRVCLLHQHNRGESSPWISSLGHGSQSIWSESRQQSGVVLGMRGGGKAAEWTKTHTTAEPASCARIGPNSALPQSPGRLSQALPRQGPTSTSPVHVIKQITDLVW